MDREEAKVYAEYAKEIEAYANGKTIQWYNKDRSLWVDCDNDFSPLFNPLDGEKYRIKPEPKRRLMTRNEVLGFVAHNPHIVVRIHNCDWQGALGWAYGGDIDRYEWATITERGEIGEPHKFEIEDNQ